MRKIVFAAAAVSALALASPALAQADAPFTGPRVEALIGYDNIQDGSDGESDGRDGLAYGGAIGYDIQAGGVVIGGEGEITGATTKAGSRNVFATGDALRVSAGRDLYVGGRVGFVISPTAMVYAKGGYTNAQVESRYALGTANVTDRSNLDGFRVGAGVEYQMGPRTYIKGEYRYSNYGNFDGVDIDLDRHQLMAGVGFRF